MGSFSIIIKGIKNPNISIKIEDFNVRVYNDEGALLIFNENFYSIKFELENEVKKIDLLKVKSFPINAQISSQYQYEVIL